jgi:hypothetical protein
MYVYYRPASPGAGLQVLVVVLHEDGAVIQTAQPWASSRWASRLVRASNSAWQTLSPVEAMTNAA